MPELTEVQKDLQALAAGLKQLEAEYNMFFAGRLPRPPWETRSRVEALVKRWDRGYIQSAADRFQFDTLQRRFQTFVDLWDRGLRAREEGRPGPFAQPPPKAAPPKTQEPESRRSCTSTAFQDPMREMDKLHTLYDSLMDARREAGRGRRAVPPVRGAGQGSGDQAARRGHGRSGVPRGGEGRESELYGAGGLKERERRS